MPFDREFGDTYIRILPAGRNGLDDPFADFSQVRVRLVQELLNFIEAAQLLGPFGQEPNEGVDAFRSFSHDESLPDW
jgi:hypothetical protein